MSKAGMEERVRLQPGRDRKMPDGKKKVKFVDF